MSSPMGNFALGLYNALFRRNTAMLGSVFIGAFAFQMIFDTATDKIWDNLNRGRQWKDIKQRYMQHDDDEE